jgi:class 3 adenylate cyclase
LIDGLDVLAADRSAPEVRAILNALLDSLNSAAAGHGVEPLRSVGESYIGVCGLSSPYLDHATRTLACARTATLALERMGEEWAKSVSLRFGLASGEIDVLLITRGHTAYDIWGHTLGVARRIVQEADPGCVRVSESTYALLTDVEGFEPCPPIETPAFGTIMTWSRSAVERLTPDVSAGPKTRATSDGE